jgi:hypothetical protein
VLPPDIRPKDTGAVVSTAALRGAQ